MALNPYLFFDGNCEEAFQLYEKCLGGKIEAIQRFEGYPMDQQVPPDWGKKVMHASLKLSDGTRLMGADTLPGHYETPRGFSVCFSVKDVAESERIFGELSEGGNVTMPIQQTFWSLRFGMCMDRYGIAWMVNCEQEAARAGA